jgi:hypothetical protein
MPFLAAIIPAAVEAGTAAAAAVGDGVATAAAVGGDAAATAASAGGDAAATAASVGGEAASAGGEAASVGGEAASVGGETASTGDEVGSVASRALTKGLDALKGRAGVNDNIVKGIKIGRKIGSAEHHLQNVGQNNNNGPQGAPEHHQIGGLKGAVENKIGEVTGALQNKISGPEGAPGNNQIELTEALEGLRNLQQEVETLQGQLAHVDGPEGHPAAAQNPLTTHMPGISDHGPVELGDLNTGVEPEISDHGPVALGDLNASVEENPFPLEHRAGSGNLRI